MKRWLVALAVALCLQAMLGTAARAQEEANPAAPVNEAFVNQLVGAPEKNWDALLAAHRADLTGKLLDKLMQICGDDAQQNKINEARHVAVLTDYIQYYRVKNGMVAVRPELRQYHPLAQCMFARGLLQAKKLAEAEPIARDLVARYPNDYLPHLLLGGIYQQKSDHASAKREFKAAIAISPKAEEPHFLLGMSYTLTSETPLARAEFEKVLQINPQNNFAKDALALIDGKAKTSGAAQTPAGTQHMQKAEILFQQGQFGPALEEYKQAAAAEPRYAPAYVYMGDCYFAMGQMNQAIASYQQAIQVDPKNREAYRFLGDAYEKLFDERHDVRMLDLSIDAYQKALQVDANYNLAREALERARRKRQELR